jgi:glycosyltransferase involved in cell wall biosynthesis
LKWSTRHNGRRATLIFADSEATKADLLKFDNVAAEKVTVVYPSIDPELKRIESEAEITAVLQKHGLTRPYLLYISTLQPRKNLIRLIQAYAQSELPQTLVLAGKKGWLSQPILDEISSLQPYDKLRAGSPISEKIILPGYIPESDKAGLISGATAVLYPSLYEGFGFPILEAQACGVPVLTANSSSCPEVAGTGALLVDPLSVADMSTSLKEIVLNKPLRAELVAQGSKNLARFSWQEAAAQVLNLLETAV